MSLRAAAAGADKLVDAAAAGQAAPGQTGVPAPEDRQLATSLEAVVCCG